MIKLSDELHIQGMGEIIRERSFNAMLEEEKRREERKAVQKNKRQYAASKLNRLNDGWITQPLTANYVLRLGLRVLRARARQMSGDAPHFKKFLSMCRSNIVGPHGMRLQCRARRTDGSLNVELNKRTEEAFWQWGHREYCTISGKLNWIRAQRLFVTQLARDGEVLVQKIAAKNPFGFTLKFIDVSYLDEFYNVDLNNGNRIIMSVEVDRDGRPVAYWLTTPASDYMFTRNADLNRVRVSADEMIHAFLVYDDESQVRGVTWFHAALLQGKNLFSYVEGVVTSARLTAMSMGFIVKNDANDEVEYTGEIDPQSGQERDIEIHQGPAQFTQLPDGFDVKQFDPKQPTQNHAAFKKSMEIDLGAALDVPYFDLTGDMEAVNYSSARVGLSESRDIWRSLQNDVADMFCREVYHAWCQSAWLNGALRLTNKEFMEIQNPVWRGRGWPYINPKDEVDASSTALQNKLTTWTDELAERGIDLIDHLETLQQEQELAAHYNVDLTAVTKTTATEPGPNADAKPTETEPKRGYSNGLDVGDYDN